MVEDIALTVEDIDLPEARDVIRPTTKPNVTVLDTDILFAFGEASLPAAAQAKLVTLASQIPDGSAVTVAGTPTASARTRRTRPSRSPVPKRSRTCSRVPSPPWS